MKKQITTTASVLAALLLLMNSQRANAQLKVYSDGKIYVGGTTTTPSSLLSVGGAGTLTSTGYFYRSAQGTSLKEAALETKMDILSSGGGSFYGVKSSIPSGLANTYAIRGGSENSTPQTSGGNAVGVMGVAGNGVTGYNYGCVGLLTGTNNGAGLYAGISALSGPIPAQYAAYLNGEIATTDATPEKPGGGSWSTLSDIRVKKNVKDFKDGLNVILKIRPVNFNYNGVGGLSEEKSYVGIIAQEVQKVAPYCIGKSKIAIKENEKSTFGEDAVSTRQNAEGKSESIAEVLNYNQDGLFYAMINSIKELDEKNKKLDEKIAELEKQIKSTTGQNMDTDNDAKTCHIELANNNQAILYQNEPNPFDGATVIRYFIPENTAGTAFVTFYDAYGKEVNKLEIKEKGFGRIEAGTSNLANGIYSYSIIINDKTVDTKRMLKSK